MFFAAQIIVRSITIRIIPSKCSCAFTRVAVVLQSRSLEFIVGSGILTIYSVVMSFDLSYGKRTGMEIVRWIVETEKEYWFPRTGQPGTTFPA